MRKLKRAASASEAMRKKWKIRILLEKGYTENAAEWMAGRIESLVDYMQYGYALIAYFKQDGTFQFVKATLLPYENAFHREYDMRRIEACIVYWDVELEAWRSFQLENFMEWRPII